MLPPRDSRKSIASAPSDATCKLICTLASLNASRVSRTSPGLSSTKRTSIGAAFVPIAFHNVLSSFGQRKDKRWILFRVATRPRFCRPSRSRIFLANSQSNSGSLEFISPVQPLEKDKNPFEILRGNPQAIVAHGKDPFAQRR